MTALPKTGDACRTIIIMATKVVLSSADILFGCSAHSHRAVSPCVTWPFAERERERERKRDTWKQSGWSVIPNTGTVKIAATSCKKMAFFSKFPSRLLWPAKMSTKQHLKPDKEIPDGKSGIFLTFPHFSLYAFTADCLSMRSLNCALSGSGAFRRISAVYFCHLRFG